jgi:hypothetical protein
MRQNWEALTRSHESFTPALTLEQKLASHPQNETTLQEFDSHRMPRIWCQSRNQSNSHTRDDGAHEHSGNVVSNSFCECAANDTTHDEGQNHRDHTNSTLKCRSSFHGLEPNWEVVDKEHHG